MPTGRLAWREQNQFAFSTFELILQRFDKLDTIVISSHVWDKVEMT